MHTAILTRDRKTPTDCQFSNFLSVVRLSVTTEWHVIGLQMEETAFRYGG